jgi:hypothetical protein
MVRVESKMGIKIGEKMRQIISILLFFFPRIFKVDRMAFGGFYLGSKYPMILCTIMLFGKPHKLRVLVVTVPGHLSCNYHLHKFGLRQSTLYDRCQSYGDETMYHLVSLCPSLANRVSKSSMSHVLDSS